MTKKQDNKDNLENVSEQDVVQENIEQPEDCLLYTSDAADE